MPDVIEGGTSRGNSKAIHSKKHFLSYTVVTQIYKWTNTSVILSSFFWTYLVATVIAPPLEKKYGPKWFLFWAILLNTIAFMMIPVSAAYAGSTGVIICRLLQGIGQGVLFPTQQIVLGLWAPAEERARACTVATAGITIGAVCASFVSGYLSTTWWGWPSSFYFFGILGLLWCALYAYLGQNSPASHPRITHEEKKYIQMSLNQRQNIDVSIPWKKILTSVHVWAVIFGQIGFSWSMNMSVTEYPTFLAKVMKFNIRSNGFYSSLPPAMGLVTSIVAGAISDYAIKNRYISTVNCRRTFQIEGGLIISASVIYLSYLNESQKSMSVLIMVIAHMAQTSMVCGNNINMVDLSPRFAGVIYGLANATSQGIALFAPLLVHWIVSDQSDITQWRIVFFITAAIMLGTSAFFVIFASGKQQLWDGPKELKLEENSAKTSMNSIAVIKT